MNKPAIHHAIVSEIVRAFEKLGAPDKLLGAIDSWGDTLDDADVLELLRMWNETGDIRLS